MTRSSVQTRPVNTLAHSPSGTAFDQYLGDVRKLPMIPSVEEERRLAELAQGGDREAAERLVTGNLRFVISYVKRFQGHGLDLAELVAIGNEGLLKAVAKFDPSHGVKFISYAVWWVRQCVLKALAEQTRTVRVPLNQNSALLRLARLEATLARELGRTPTDGETAVALGDTVDSVRAAHRMSRFEISLDAPVDRSDSAAATFGDRVAGSGSLEIEDATDDTLQREFLAQLFRQHLTPRERRILTLYYGLDDCAEPLTLEHIGHLLGVTRERVRQIRERAFEKLRNAPEVQNLRTTWVAA